MTCIVKWILVAAWAILCREIHAQVQHIAIGGHFGDTYGYPIPRAQMYLRFNDDTLFGTQADNNGEYTLRGQIYGKIREIDILCQAEGYESLSFMNYEVYRLASLSDFIMKRVPEPALAEPIVNVCSLKGYQSPPDQRYDYHFDRLFCTAWDIIDEAKPTELPYCTKITQQIIVLNTEGFPINYARVEVKVPGDKACWGYTDAYGKLALYMEFTHGARQATISIRVPGYRPLKLRRQGLEARTQSIYHIHKTG